MLILLFLIVVRLIQAFHFLSRGTASIRKLGEKRKQACLLY